MSPAAGTKFAPLYERLAALSSGSLSVASVSIVEEQFAEGDTVRIALRLSAPGADQWDSEEFLHLRRQARSITADELDGDSDVRLVYEAALVEEDVKTNQVSTSDKQSPGENL